MWITGANTDMCIGIPMQVVESGFGHALCEGMGQRREVDTLLVGEQPPGTWLLVFLNSAREVLTEDDARRISDAVQAVDLVMQHGGRFSDQGLQHDALETLFADLIDRDPPKPDSLLAHEQASQKKGD